METGDVGSGTSCGRISCKLKGNKSCGPALEKLLEIDGVGVFGVDLEEIDRMTMVATEATLCSAMKKMMLLLMMSEMAMLMSLMVVVVLELTRGHNLWENR